MDEQVQFLPSLQDICTQDYPPQNWIMFYKNTWQRKLIAQTIDVNTDTKLKAQNPELMVNHETDAMGNPTQIAVKYRLELRKQQLATIMLILDSINDLSKLDSVQLAAFWTPEALATAPEILAETNGATAADKQNYVVVSEAGVTLSGTEDVTPKGTVVILDANDADTKELLANGTIELATAENTQEAAPAEQEETETAETAEVVADDTEQEAAPAEQEAAAQ